MLVKNIGKMNDKHLDVKNEVGETNLVCDVCVPRAKGYSVYFPDAHSMTLLLDYLKESSADEYKLVDNTTVWLLEPVFFSFVDYAAVHLGEYGIEAVEAEVFNLAKNENNKKPIHLFAKERETAWIDELISENRIITHYQPIVRIEENIPTIYGHEFLSRGLNKDESIIPPYKLFEAARVRNRVFSLDRACRLQSVRNAGIVKDKLIFINFIPTAIYVPEHCLASTFALIKELEVEPSQVVFEVVETDEVQNIDHLKSILSYYRKHGFKYALDDVGTGYNHVDKLELLDPDVVKLAIDYVNGVSKDKQKQEVALAVLQRSHAIGALALAEGVEHIDDYHFLKDMGYDLFQGYLFAKPLAVPMTDLELQGSMLQKS